MLIAGDATHYGDILGGLIAIRTFFAAAVYSLLTEYAVGYFRVHSWLLFKILIKQRRLKGIFPCVFADNFGCHFRCYGFIVLTILGYLLELSLFFLWYCYG